MYDFRITERKFPNGMEEKILTLKNSCRETLSEGEVFRSKEFDFGSFDNFNSNPNGKPLLTEDNNKIDGNKIDGKFDDFDRFLEYFDNKYSKQPKEDFDGRYDDYYNDERRLPEWGITRRIPEPQQPPRVETQTGNSFPQADSTGLTSQQQAILQYYTQQNPYAKYSLTDLNGDKVLTIFDAGGEILAVVPSGKLKQQQATQPADTAEVREITEEQVKALKRLAAENPGMAIEKDKNDPRNLFSRQTIKEKGVEKTTTILPDGTTIERTVNTKPGVLWQMNNILWNSMNINNKYTATITLPNGEQKLFESYKEELLEAAIQKEVNASTQFTIQ